MTAAIVQWPDRSPLPFDLALSSADRSRMLITALPEPLQEVLAAGRVARRACFSDGGFDGVAETWLPPATAHERHAVMARNALNDLRCTVLAPVEPGHLLARILALLSHYPAKGMAPEVEQLVAMDWAEDLGEFPAWAVDAAARTWRRTRKWRPSIAEMRALCEEACAQERALAERLATLARIRGTTGESGAVPGTAGLRRMP